MQIWTEDSSAGYYYWKNINKILFNNRFKVIGHKGNRDLLFKMERYNSDEIIFIIADSMVDDVYTKATYENICRESLKHEHMYVPSYGCTERIFLSYRDLEKYVKVVNKYAELFRSIVLNNSTARGTIELSNITDINFLRNYSSMNSEHILKSVLAGYTNNTHALISGSDLGACWCTDCCVHSDNKTCKFDVEITNNDKTMHIYKNSELLGTINSIRNNIVDYLNDNYSETYADAKYKLLVLKCINEIDLGYYVERYMRIYGHSWNYERIYRALQEKVI